MGASGLLPAGTLLPPGLYLPSSEHLGHALMSAGTFQSPAPRFFSPPEFAIIRKIAELILGEEPGTPVAGEVAAWIDLKVSSSAGVRAAATGLESQYRTLAIAYYGGASVHDIESFDPQTICREGLAWLRERGDFVSLDANRQIELLNSISDARPDKNDENAGTRFFAFIKSETIRGFYTSRTGLKELDFRGNGFYASSPGCRAKKE